MSSGPAVFIDFARGLIFHQFQRPSTSFCTDVGVGTNHPVTALIEIYTVLCLDICVANWI